MLEILRTFLAMEPERQCMYQVGRRAGFFSTLSDMESPTRLARAEKLCRDFNITPENVEDTIAEMMKRFHLVPVHKWSLSAQSGVFHTFGCRNSALVRFPKCSGLALNQNPPFMNGY